MHGSTRVGYTHVSFDSGGRESDADFSLNRVQDGHTVPEAVAPHPKNRPVTSSVGTFSGSAEIFVPTPAGRYVVVCNQGSTPEGRPLSEVVAAAAAPNRAASGAPTYTSEIKQTFRRGYQVHGLTAGSQTIKVDNSWFAIDPVHHGEHDPFSRLVQIGSPGVAYLRINLRPGRYSVNNGADASEGETQFTLTADGQMTQVDRQGAG